MSTQRTPDIEGVFSECGHELAPQLAEWIRITKECAVAWDYEDVPWWYNERAQLSLFAGAVWKTGGLAFEEFSATKRRTDLPYSGRSDIYFKLGSKAYIAEAKHIGLLTSDGTFTTKVAKALALAFEECKSSTDPCKGRLGILFVTLRTHTRNESELKSIIDSFVAQLKRTPCCACAWVFPGRGRTHRSEDSVHYHPGGAILIKALDNH